LSFLKPALREVDSDHLRAGLLSGCASQNALQPCPQARSSARPAGRLAASSTRKRLGCTVQMNSLRERPRIGERHVVAAWPGASDGRKHHSASALYDATARVLAVADALWIELRDPAAFGAEPLDPSSGRVRGGLERDRGVVPTVLITNASGNLAAR